MAEKFHLDDAIQQTPSFREAIKGAEQSAPSSFPLSDLGNAERLIDRFGDNIRYCTPWKRWLVSDGKRWLIDQSQQVMVQAKKTVRAIYFEAGAAPGEGERKAIASHALRSEGEKRMAAMVKLAEMHVPIMPEHLDTNPWLLNCENGTIDLRSGDLRRHKREDFITKCVPIHYSSEVPCPLWLDFLSKTFGGNIELIEWLQRAIGYSLTGITTEQCFFLCHGVGSNGKSTFLDTLRSILGDYGEQAAFQTFLRTEGEAIRNDLAKLAGCRFIAAIETDEGKRLAEALIKSLTGGEELTARFLYSEFFTYRPLFKIWLATNHRPEIQGTDHAIWRRVRLIPFNNIVPDDKQDEELGEKLKKELPGILAWSVRGCLAWQSKKLKPAPEIVQVATKEYREEQDALGSFLTDRCMLQPALTVPAGDLYAAYSEWAAKAGEKALTQTSLASRLKERGFFNDRSTLTGKRIWRGLGINLND